MEHSAGREFLFYFYIIHLFRNCTLVFEEIVLAELVVLILIFFPKLATLVLTFDLEHSSHITSLKSVFHQNQPSNLSW